MDTSEIQKELDEIEERAWSRCGHFDHLFTGFFTSYVDDFVFDLPEAVQAQVIELAKTRGYGAIVVRQVGECRHYIQWEYCPFGCDHYEFYDADREQSAVAPAPKVGTIQTSPAPAPAPVAPPTTERLYKELIDFF